MESNGLLMENFARISPVGGSLIMPVLKPPPPLRAVSLADNNQHQHHHHHHHHHHQMEHHYDEHRFDNSAPGISMPGGSNLPQGGGGGGGGRQPRNENTNHASPLSFLHQGGPPPIIEPVKPAVMVPQQDLPTPTQNTPPMNHNVEKGPMMGGKVVKPATACHRKQRGAPMGMAGGGGGRRKSRSPDMQDGMENGWEENGGGQTLPQGNRYGHNTHSAAHHNGNNNYHHVPRENNGRRKISRTCVLVENLPSQETTSSLYAAFRRHGDITAIQRKDASTATVAFVSDRSAYEMHVCNDRVNVNGLPLMVSFTDAKVEEEFTLKAGQEVGEEEWRCFICLHINSKGADSCKGEGCDVLRDINKKAIDTVLGVCEHSDHDIPGKMQHNRRTIVATGLPKLQSGTEKGTVAHVFSNYGGIEQVWVHKGSQGLEAHITFASEAEADYAVECEHNRLVDAKPLIVWKATTAFVIEVAPLAGTWLTSPTDAGTLRTAILEEFQLKYGVITNVHIHPDAAYVEYPSFTSVVEFLAGSPSLTLNGHRCAASLSTRYSKWPCMTCLFVHNPPDTRACIHCAVARPPFRLIDLSTAWVRQVEAVRSSNDTPTAPMEFDNAKRRQQPREEEPRRENEAHGNAAQPQPQPQGQGQFGQQQLQQMNGSFNRGVIVPVPQAPQQQQQQQYYPQARQQRPAPLLGGGVIKPVAQPEKEVDAREREREREREAPLDSFNPAEQWRAEERTMSPGKSRGDGTFMGMPMIWGQPLEGESATQSGNGVREEGGTHGTLPKASEDESLKISLEGLLDDVRGLVDVDGADNESLQFKLGATPEKPLGGRQLRVESPQGLLKDLQEYGSGSTKVDPWDHQHDVDWQRIGDFGAILNGSTNKGPTHYVDEAEEDNPLAAVLFNNPTFC